jgi:hypothetical protein
MPCSWSCTDAMVALPKRGSHGHRAYRAARGGMEHIAQTRVLVGACGSAASGPISHVGRNRTWEDRPGLATPGLVNDQHGV